MSNEQSTYHVGVAINSAVGDHAQVNNYFSAQAAGQDKAVAELRRLFEEVNERLAALDPADREMITPAVAQTTQAVAEIQQGDESEAKQSFLETRLKNLYAMAPDIGQVIITTLANPIAGVALTIQKIAQKAKSEVGLA